MLQSFRFLRVNKYFCFVSLFLAFFLFMLYNINICLSVCLYIIICIIVVFLLLLLLYLLPKIGIGSNIGTAFKFRIVHIFALYSNYFNILFLEMEILCGRRLLPRIVSGMPTLFRQYEWYFVMNGVNIMFNRMGRGVQQTMASLRLASAGHPAYGQQTHPKSYAIEASVLFY